MQFGYWLVDNDTISWNGEEPGDFAIPINKLNTTRKEGNEEYYDWILLATNQDWLSQNDLYDLNYAFVYAIAKSGLDFNYGVFDATLEKQFDLFDLEDEDDFQ